MFALKYSSWVAIAVFLLHTLVVEALLRPNLTTEENKELQVAVSKLLEHKYSEEGDGNLDTPGDGESMIDFDDFNVDGEPKLSIVDGALRYVVNASLSRATSEVTVPLETTFHPNVTTNYTVSLNILNCRVRVEGVIEANSSSCVDTPRLWLLDPASRFRITNVSNPYVDNNPAYKEEVSVLLSGYSLHQAPEGGGIYLYTQGRPTDFAEEEEDWASNCTQPFRDHLTKNKLVLN